MAYGSSPSEINKFKFQIRKRLSKENVLYVISKERQIKNFIKTLQLSEKLEPQSYEEFLKTILILGKKSQSTVYKSKLELKATEQRTKSLEDNFSEILNQYMLDLWDQRCKAQSQGQNQGQGNIKHDFREYLVEVLQVLSQDRESSMIVLENEDLARFNDIGSNIIFHFFFDFYPYIKF